VHTCNEGNEDDGHHDAGNDPAPVRYSACQSLHARSMRCKAGRTAGFEWQ